MITLPAAHAPYAVPALPAHPDRLYVVTPYFNPRRFRSRPRLYRAFQKQMAESGAQLLTVEIAYGDRPFEVTEPHDPWSIQLRTSADLWNKERAINIGIDRLEAMIPDLKYVAWIDADITFTRPDWAQETIQMLQHHPFIQLYGSAINLDPDGHPQWNCSSAFREFFWCGHTLKNGEFYKNAPTAGHPGLAWAATMDALDITGGLLDFAISGSGDLHMANSLKGQWALGHSVEESITRFSTGFVNAMKEWSDKAAKFHKNVGYVNGSVVHHWHGKPSQRGYPDRWDILEHYKFDPYLDIQQDEQGLWQFMGNKPEMEMAIRQTMILRNEDSIDA